MHASLIVSGWLALLPFGALISQVLCRIWKLKKSRVELFCYGALFVTLGLVLMYFLSKGVWVGEMRGFCRGCTHEYVLSRQPISFWATALLSYVVIVVAIGTGLACLRLWLRHGKD